MDNNKFLEKFYSSFSIRDFEKMNECYHKDILFRDPIFGTLKGERVLKMWEMLLNRRTNNTKISFTNIQTTMQKVTATGQQNIFMEKITERLLIQLVLVLNLRMVKPLGISILLTCRNGFNKQ